MPIPPIGNDLFLYLPWDIALIYPVPAFKTHRMHNSKMASFNGKAEKVAPAGARLVQSGNLLQQSQIPGLSQSQPSGQRYAPAQGFQTAAQISGTACRYPVPMQSRASGTLTSKAADSQPLSTQNGRLSGLGLPEAQGFANSIPGLGLPVEKPKAPAKETVLPRVSHAP